jgi:aminoglycoside/choline kinase family phosphotransferase
MTGPGGQVPPQGDGRDTVIADFLDQAGFGAAKLDFLSGDASFRRYARLTGGPRPAMLMDAAPDKEDVRPWLAVCRHLRALGFSAPEVIAAEEGRGLLVIEDFGDDTFTRALGAGGDEGALYDLAGDVLIDLHSRPIEGAVPDWLPPYDDARLLEETALLVDWYLPEITGESVSKGLREDFLGLWCEVLPLARQVPETLVLRDYHVDNLMWLPGREAIAACGLLDFQDAVAGPVVYDVVSLLEDARRDLGEGIKARALKRYLDGVDGLDPEAFAAAGAVMAAGRNAKIIGIFTRLWKRDGKPVYLHHIPRVWRLLEEDLRHPALASLKAWFDAALPGETRVQPAPGGDA